MDNKQDIVVSICCITYNHEDYIRQCLDGFIIQETNFLFEILVHEDASTDNTANIVKEYETKYPQLFRCVYQKENQFEKQNALFNILIPMSKGKYITLCEGDDFWIDPYKLQKQVDFMESNPEYGLVHTDVNKRVENKNRTVQTYYVSAGIKHVINPSVCDIIAGFHPITTCSILFRQDLVNSLLKDKNYLNFKMGDYPLFCEIASNSKIKYLNEVTATRRVLNESATQSKNFKKKLSFIESGKEAAYYIIKKFGCSSEIIREVDINTEKYKLNLFFNNKETALLKMSVKKLKDNNYKFKLSGYIFIIASLSHILHVTLLLFYKGIMKYKN